MSSIVFNTRDVDFRLRNKLGLKRWIFGVASSERVGIDMLSYIFCSDNYLHEVNVKYLNHDTFTDVITFDYSRGRLISGDVFISIDAVFDNAKTFCADKYDELHRVILHGVLHLIGYKDKNDDALIMRQKEDYYLARRSVDR